MSRIVLAFVVTSFVLACLQSAAAASEGYVRFCTYAEKETEAQLRAANLEQWNRFPVHKSDATIIAAAKRAFASSGLALGTGSASFSIAAREYGVLTGHGPFAPEEAILFRVGDAKKTAHVLATFESSGQVKTLRLVSIDELAPILAFGRTMAAYILLNDLTASDASFPRRGCQMAYREQMYAIPEILPEILAAIRAEPAQDGATIALVRVALGKFVSLSNASTTAESQVARRTLRTIGPNPKIGVIYRDKDPTHGSRAEYDVIRLDGKKQAYAMFTVDATGKSDLGPMPICIVGDASCSPYYEWP